jgi:hypothetical protein
VTTRYGESGRARPREDKDKKEKKGESVGEEKKWRYKRADEERTTGDGLGSMFTSAED